MLSPLIAIGFWCTEVIFLTVFLGIGLLVSASAMIDAGPGVAHLWYLDEARRALGAAMIFIVLSGYILSITALLALFRVRPLSLTHAAWVTLLFVLHAGFFLFYLMGPAVPSTSAALIAVGTVSVIAAVATQYVVWSKWLSGNRSL